MDEPCKFNSIRLTASKLFSTLSSSTVNKRSVPTILMVALFNPFLSLLKSPLAAVLMVIDVLICRALFNIYSLSRSNKIVEEASLLPQPW